MWRTVAVIAVAFALGAAGSAPKQKVTVPEKDSGATVNLAVGDTLEVTLEGNPGTGYSWQKTAGDAAVLKAVGEPTSKAKNTGRKLVGAPEQVTFRYKAAAAGTTKLTLAYRRPWEKDKEPAKTFDVTVVVK